MDRAKERLEQGDLNREYKVSYPYIPKNVHEELSNELDDGYK